MQKRMGSIPSMLLLGTHIKKAFVKLRYALSFYYLLEFNCLLYLLFLFEFQGLTSILRYHNNSVATALVALFPETKFDQNKLKLKSKILNTLFLCLLFNFLFYFCVASWPDTKARRKFFETYAKENNFDPLLPENWYAQSKQQLTSTKVIFIYFNLYYYLIIYYYFQ
jgi:hypothetical protein